MSTLSADSRLRNRVTAIEGTVVLVGAGNVDRVIRFSPRMPACLIPFKTKTDGKSIFPVLLNLDRGPDQEAWNAAQRESFLSARRDRQMPEALPVSADNKTGWSVDADDVPVVELPQINEELGEDVKSFICETCTVNFKTENALGIHKARTKHT